MVSSRSDDLVIVIFISFYYSEVFYTVLKLRDILLGGLHLKGPCVSG